MHKIESQENFMSWAKDVNTQNGCITTVQALCDLQDAYARSEIQDIKNWFIGSDRNDKHLLIFSIQKAMGSEALIQIINAYACNRAQEVIDRELEQLAGRENAVYQSKCELAKKKESLKLSMSSLEYQNAALVKDNGSLTEESARYYRHNVNLQEQLDTATTELDELRAFESHIKGLLNS